jgi:hypothetical protein
MNKQDIINKLTNPTLDDYERESLSQMLHYLVAENKSHTSSNSSSTNSHKRTSSTSSNYKGKNPRHTSSTNTSSNTR